MCLPKKIDKRAKQFNWLKNFITVFDWLKRHKNASFSSVYALRVRIMTDCVGGVRHRKGKCDECNGCKICKCECDGLSIAEKLKRKVGAPPKHLRAKRTRSGRQKNTI